MELPGLTLTPIPVTNATAKFDLTMTMWDEPQGLSGSLEYDVDLFEAQTIERLMGHFHTLLEAAIANPDQPISRLPLLTDGEKQQLLDLWEPQPVAESSAVCLHQQFEKQVERSPDAVAVVYEDEALTYRQLDERANQLAHHLQKCGVGPDVLVGLSTERSLEMIVGILGILKAGGAYVPLDPAYPQDRLAFMLEDSQIRVWLTQEHLADVLPEQADVHVVRLDADREQIALESTDRPCSTVTPDHLAYVIYTSGSTGKPKGVLIPHQNVIRLFDSTEAWYHFDEKDVWTMFHSYAFDFSVWEIWGALLHGGKLVVVPYMVSRSPEAFYDLLVQERVTVLNQTPSAFRQLIQAEESRGRCWRVGSALCHFWRRSVGVAKPEAVVSTS